MKQIYRHIRFILLGVSLVIYYTTNSQIIIEPGPDISPEDMVENILGEGVAYDNVTLQGADAARNSFSKYSNFRWI